MKKISAFTEIQMQKLSALPAMLQNLILYNRNYNYKYNDLDLSEHKGNTSINFILPLIQIWSVSFEQNQNSFNTSVFTLVP